MKTNSEHENQRKKFNEYCDQLASVTFKHKRKENNTIEITNEQIQKLQDMLSKAQDKVLEITNGQPLNTLPNNKYGLANYWDGKIVALIEVIYLLNL